jgi:hypothetical protein
MDRRAFLGQTLKLGAGAAVAGLLSGCIGSLEDDTGSDQAALDRDTGPGFPPDRAEIERFCGRFSPGHITQFGYVVPGLRSSELDRSIARWGREQGVGPFCVLRPAPSGKAFHRGQRFAITPHGEQTRYAEDTNPDIELALGQVEDHAQVELILQRDLDPSTVYRKVYPAADQGGFHHACIVSKDLTTDLRTLFELGVQHGFQFDTLITGAIGKVLYFDARGLSGLGCHFEITQDTVLLPAISAVYRAIHHLGSTLGPFGAGMRDALPWSRLGIDRERLARTNILFEARTFAELATKALLIATKSGWIP